MPKKLSRSKATYIDGFVLVVPKKKVDVYRKMANLGKKVWLKHGALDYKECMIDDAKPKGIILTFNKMTKVKPSETVWFSYITFKSRAHRDQVNAKVMKDSSMQPDSSMQMGMPFDMKHMAYGGFKVIVG